MAEAGKKMESIPELNRLLYGRRRMLIISILYFAGLLIAGYVLFFRDIGSWKWPIAAAIVVLYLTVVRPVRKNHERALRRAILSNSVMDRLCDASYEPAAGIEHSVLVDVGFTDSIDPRSFMSRELITGTTASLSVQLSDVTFPFRENGFNKMFSGCLIHIVNDVDEYRLLEVKNSETVTVDAPLTGSEARLIERLGSFIPGSLSLRRYGNTLDVLLRGRFIGFSVNPLGNITQETLKSDPLPELAAAIELAGFTK